MGKKVVLRTKELTKKFPGVVALNKVDFKLREGEIHALVGENGAGKSTFSKILAGTYYPSYGEIYLNEKRVNIKNPLEALNLGIGMVYQERDLVPCFTATENIFLGQEMLHSGFLRTDVMREKVINLMQEIGVDVPIDIPINELRPSDQQVIEILKIMLLKPLIMILDEPTSSLTEKETTAFFNLLKSIKKKVSIIFISHCLEEVFEISDQITVLRDGEKIGTVDTKEISHKEIVKMMVDREIKDLYPKEKIPMGKVMLEISDLRADKLKEISLKVRKGEIVGLAGMVGSGRTELVETIFGLRKLKKGQIMLNDQQVFPNCPSAMIKKGVFLIPEDRRTAGLIPNMNVSENLSIAHLSKVCSGWLISNYQEKGLAQDLVKKFNIKVSDISQQINILSGGNQQKVVIGKWLAEKAKLLLMDEATAGIDVGAKREIYKIMMNLAKGGVAIIFTSSDLPELIGICDHIYVLNQGRITAEFNRENFSQQEILKYAIKE